MEDDADFKPPDASQLSAKQMIEELERRGLKPTGFPADDARLLQKAFDAEFEAHREDMMKERAEAARRKKIEEENRRREQFLSQQRGEEEAALAADPYAAFTLDLIKRSATPPELCPRMAPIAARALVKCLGDNTSLVSLDLSNMSLGDDVGTELARALRSNRTLRRLELDHNKFGPVTAAAFADLLESSASEGVARLTYLSLEGNQLCGGWDGSAGHDPSSMHALALAVAKHPTIVAVNFCSTGKWDAATGGAVASALAAGNRHMQTFLVSPLEGLPAEAVDRIGAIVTRNTREAASTAAAAKLERAKARMAAAAAAAAAEAEAKVTAEATWVAQQMAIRADARAEAAARRQLEDMRVVAMWEKEAEEKREAERQAAELKKQKAAEKAAKKKKK